MKFFIKLLIKFEIKKNTNMTPLYYAVEKDNADAVKILLTSDNIDVNTIINIFINYHFFI